MKHTHVHDESDSGDGSMKLELDEYQAVNLLWALERIVSGDPRTQQRHIKELNTGDWVYEIMYKLQEWEKKHIGPKIQPNGF